MSLDRFPGRLSALPRRCTRCGGSRFAWQPPYRVCLNGACQAVVMLAAMPMGRHPRRWHALAALARRHGWCRGAELGVQRGLTMLYLLDTVPGLSMIGVDLWAPQPDNPGPETYEDWPHARYEHDLRAQLVRHAQRARLIKADTVRAAAAVADGSLDFVFIDADHRAQAVAADIRAWAPKVKETGWLIGHDLDWAGVHHAVSALLPGFLAGPDTLWARAKVPALHQEGAIGWEAATKTRAGDPTRVDVAPPDGEG